MSGLRPSIRLTISHPTAGRGVVHGFRYLWAYYVRGYRSDRHCQPCFRGVLASEFSTRHASTGVTLLTEIDRFPYVYVCGVGSGPKRELHQKNLHLPLRYLPGSKVEVQSYNGYFFRAEDAEAVVIPTLPDGWNGLPLEKTRCKNFQFAVAMFGYPSPPRTSRTVSTELSEA
jgi:hypothetical protein